MLRRLDKVYELYFKIIDSFYSLLPIEHNILLSLETITLLHDY